jgi:hypothetical protein
VPDHIPSAKWYPLERDAYRQMQAQASKWRSVGLLKPVGSGEARLVSMPLMVAKRDPRTGAVLPERCMAIDLRQLNKHLQSDKRAPAPRLLTVQRIVSRAALVTQLDFSNMFMQFPIAPEDQAFFVIQTAPGRLEKLTGVPFGVSTMPGHAQGWMELRIVGGDDDKAVYLDDLMLEHLRGPDLTWDVVGDQIETLFERLGRFNLVVNVDKLQLATPTPVLLGYELDCENQTFRPNPLKSRGLADLPKPSTQRSLVRWINSVAALQHSLPGANQALGTLRAMLGRQRAGRLEWSVDGSLAWSALVDLLSDTVHMVHYDESQKVFVWTDASAHWLFTAFVVVGYTL